MLSRLSIIIVCTLLQVQLWSQDYTEGFEYLEQGKFDQAESFFQKFIDQDSKDKSVNLCYGRAVGLNGNPQKAESIFLEMLDQYKGDYELKLNYAESLMWQKKYEQAEKSYRKLVREDKQSFAASLGYANALSSVRKYEEAALQVKEALDLKPNNANAMVSRKYILLGRAEQLKLSHREQEANSLLKQLAMEYSNDKDILIALSYLQLDLQDYKAVSSNIDSLQKYYPQDAKVYQLASNRYMRLLKHNHALESSQEALDHHDQNDSALGNALIEQYVNTLIAKKDYKVVDILIDSLSQHDNSKQLSQKLRVNRLLAVSDYTGLNSIINSITEGEYRQETKARMSLQKGNPWQVDRHLDSLYRLNPQSVFHYYFEKELQKSWYNQLKFDFLHLEDNGDNVVNQFSLDYESLNHNRWQFILAYRLRASEQSELLSANMQNILAGLRYRFSWDFSAEASIGYAFANRNDKAQLSEIIYKLKVKKKFSERHHISVSGLRNYYDYNVSLIDNEVFEDRFGLEYFRKFINQFGIYTNAAFSILSDENTSSNIFLSLFRDFSELPLIQSGVNVQWLSYADAQPLYFSPSSYTGVEVFAKFDNRFHPVKRWIYSITGAIGIQTIEDQSSQSTQRYELEFGYKPNYRSWAMIYYRFNNASSATIAGFQARSIGLKGDLRF